MPQASPVPAMVPIGVVKSDEPTPPRHWTVSQVRGTIELQDQFAPALADYQPGDRIVVLFCFHKSPAFDPALHLRQTPPHKEKPMGVFSICSPVRPNPIGLSVVTIEKIQGSVLSVQGLDMLDGTPVLDIKPHIEQAGQGPSYRD